MPMPKKRSDEKLGRPNTVAQTVDKIEVEADLRVPEPGPDWHPVAVYAWEEFLQSPVMQFTTGTDLAFAWATCDALNVAITKRSAMAIQAAESMMRNALFTEQARRSARIEITRKAPEPDSQVEDNVAQFRARRSRDAS